MAIMQQWIIPTALNSLQPFKDMDWAKMVERVFLLAVSWYGHHDVVYDHLSLSPLSLFLSLYAASKSPLLVAGVLFPLPLPDEPGGGDPSLWGQEVLQRLVECQQHQQLLEDLEHPCTPLGLQVRSTSRQVYNIWGGGVDA